MTRSPKINIKNAQDISVTGKRYPIVEKNNKMKVSDLKTWEDFCHYSKRSHDLLPDVRHYDLEDQKHAIADFKLTIIIKIFNEGWRPDFSNNNQEKWYNWFEYDASRGCFVLYDADTDYGSTNTLVGARFCFPTEGRANTFASLALAVDLYNDLLLLKV